MEELEVEKVVKCWPARTEAAVKPIVDFLTDETKEMIEKPQLTILPYDEWPEEIPKSYVRASDAQWEKIVEEGYKRGLFHHCPDSEVLRGPDGTKILNGAGAVPKEKNGERLQRFISIFCPLNAVSRKVEGQESTLPYVGQVCLLNIPDEETILIDSENLQSAFNLFAMPEGWRGMFCYEKQVRGDLLGLPTADPVYVSLRTVPMGWVSAVGIVQAAIRWLAFEEAKISEEQEVQKQKDVPKGDKFLLYLDSVDQLRQASKGMAKVLAGTPSPEHERFEEACARHGLPRNQSKRLAGALAGTIQGRDLLGEEGLFSLNIKKMQENVGFCLALLSMSRWDLRRASGVVGRLIFASAFRRPLLAGLAEVFHHFTRKKIASTVKAQAYDEILGFLGLLPFAFTNLRAPVHPELHATDASPLGAGSCIAKQIKRPAGVANPAQLLCVECRKDITEEISRGEEIDCPKKCGQHFCGMDCYLQHRKNCSRASLGIPVFRADAVRVRQGNKMALTSVRRCKQQHANGRYFSLEHPYGSFFWYMKEVEELSQEEGVYLAVFSNCCYGGKRRKWTAVLTNNKELYEGLHQEDCPHGPGESYQPYERDGAIVYPTEEEAEYPTGLCRKYAEVLADQFGLDNHVKAAHRLARLMDIETALSHYHRFVDTDLKTKMAQAVLDMEDQLLPGAEQAHLEALLSKGHYRGTDVRLSVEHCGAKHLVPYPALHWVWRELLSFRWKAEAHINVLEAQALLAHVRRVLRDPTMRSCRIMVVIDSQVLYFALGKGRSPSTQLNRILRRLMALMLATDTVRALKRFIDFVEEEEEALPSTYRALDRLLSRFIEHMWMDDEPISYAGHLLSGLRRFLPEARWRIPRARQFYTNWQSVHVTKQAAPMPPEVLMAFAGLAIATHQPSLAALLLVAYLAFLRTGEFVSRSPAKVAVDTARGYVLVALPSTKTSRQREETVCIEDVRRPGLRLGSVEQQEDLLTVLGIRGGSAIQFWAAGRGCCEEGFDCGDARHGAKGGLVSGVLTPFRNVHGHGPKNGPEVGKDALFSDTVVDRLRSAAKAAEVQHALRASPDALFVFLSAAPGQVQQGYWTRGVIFVVCASIVYFVLCVLVGFGLHCLPRHRSKLEMRRY
eukprot:Skav214751  [mRNA]  locus=scaffold983:190131:202825:- [translate_table: standard]